MTIHGDNSGEAQYQYDAFGALRAGSPLPGSQRFLFTGQQLDAKPNASTGLYYLRARYYDPSIGRFLTPDPLHGSVRSGQSQNRYVYALNNPTTRVDPRGLDSERAGSQVTGAATVDPLKLSKCAAAISHLVEFLAVLGIGYTLLPQGAVAILAQPQLSPFVVAIVLAAASYFAYEIYQECPVDQSH